MFLVGDGMPTGFQWSELHRKQGEALSVPSYMHGSPDMPCYSWFKGDMEVTLTCVTDRGFWLSYSDLRKQEALVQRGIIAAPVQKVQSNWIQKITPWLPLLSFIGTAITIAVGLWLARWNLKKKREDDQHNLEQKRLDSRRENRLSRINLQLRNLYGKLSMLYAAGERHWTMFMDMDAAEDDEFDKKDKKFRRFFPPEGLKIDTASKYPKVPTPSQLESYRYWLRNRFLKTNQELAKIIIENADLVVGKKVAEKFTDFIEHVASLEILLVRIEKAEADKNESFLNNWRNYATPAVSEHPGGLIHYINASVEVLRREQEMLLTTNEPPFTEEELAVEINYCRWEKDIAWRVAEKEAYRKMGREYEEVSKYPDEPVRLRRTRPASTLAVIEPASKATETSLVNVAVKLPDSPANTDLHIENAVKQ